MCGLEVTRDMSNSSARHHGTEHKNIKRDFMADNHRIGLWENLQESPIFDGKNHGFL